MPGPFSMSGTVTIEERSGERGGWGGGRETMVGNGGGRQVGGTATATAATTTTGTASGSSTTRATASVSTTRASATASSTREVGRGTTTSLAATPAAPARATTTAPGAAGIDAQLWHACAGAMVHLPKMNDKVIYFPQGHAEHAASPPDFPRTLSLSSTIPCRVLSVSFLADTETDEVYARIRLQPDPSAAAPDPSDDSPPSPSIPEKTASFAKTLTQSDANNGGGFSVPRYCAETIFPRLDYTEDPPVQIVHAKDVHGTVWKFRHIYRGTPRRHLLTTGWSNFVNQKKLVAGDAIVFLRSASGELCVGVRRSTRGTGAGDSFSWHLSGLSNAAVSAAHRPSRWEVKVPENSYDFLRTTDSGTGLNRVLRPGADIVSTTSNFARNRARVTAESVLEAATLAAERQPFEVVYYPRATISEFFVKSRAVKTALQQNWGSGMRFKMAVETEDASRISWFMGTIAKVQEADPILWPNSPWKLLQVTWDEPDLLQGISRVSPWQVELVSPMQLPPFSLPKKVRLSQPSELQLDGQGIMGLTMATLASNMLGHTNPWHGFVDSVPAGMQGARHDRSFGLSIPDFRLSKPQSGLVLDSFYQHQKASVVGGARVSTELNMGNFTHLGHSSVQNNISTTLTVGNSSHSAPDSESKWGGGSSSTRSTPFVLFGKAIDTTQSAKSRQPQLSGGSSSDGQGHETVSDGNQSEVEKIHRLLSGQGHGSKAMGTPSLLQLQGEIRDPAPNRVGNLKWFKEHASILDREKADDFMDLASTHCKIFRETDEVGRTVDLSFFNSYEELYKRIGQMFGIQKSEIQNRVVSMDSMGSTVPIGDEPYRDFMKTVKKLKILSESSSESATR